MKKKKIVLGFASFLLINSLTSCSRALEEAQANIDGKVVTVMNGNDNIKSKLGGEIEKFTFLSAETIKNNDNYAVDINGIVTARESSQKAYTTLNYVVDGSYFDNMKRATNDNIINALASVVENENLSEVSVYKVNNALSFSDAMGSVTESPLEDYELSKNLLYGIGDIQYNDSENTVFFQAKNATKFERTTMAFGWGVVGNNDGKPEYGLVAKPQTDYQTFFIDQNVYIKLNEEDFKMSKTDESVIFDKFTDFVKNKEKGKYIVATESVATEKGFSANMLEDINLKNV